MHAARAERRKRLRSVGEGIRPKVRHAEHCSHGSIIRVVNKRVRKPANRLGIIISAIGAEAEVLLQAGNPCIPMLGLLIMTERRRVCAAHGLGCGEVVEAEAQNRAQPRLLRIGRGALFFVQIRVSQR